jgi:hypothetical protein
MERLTPEAFAKAFNATPCTETPDGFAAAPVGITYWKTGRGSIMSVKDEG